MADLLALLGNAANSLSAQRALTATAGHNIQNANTPGYARQRVILTAQAPAEQVRGASIGRGVMLGTVQQTRDKFIEAQLPGAFGSAARSSAEAEALLGLRDLDPGAPGGIGESVAGFYSAMRALAQNPGDAGLRAAALGAARTLTRSFNRTSLSVEQQRSALDTKAQGVVDEINSEARAVAQLNADIQRARVGGGEPNDLLDLRQRHLDRLATLGGASSVPTSTGDVNVVLPTGTALVSGGTALSLGTEIDPANRQHLRVLAGGLDGAAAVPLPDAALSGTLGGLLAARDGALADASAQVDQLAWDLAGAVNAVHAAGYGLDGATGRALFTTGATVSGADSSLALAFSDPRQLAASADALSLPGDARNAQALVDTERAALSGGSDVQATLSTIVSAFGAETQRAKAYSDQDQAIQDHLVGMRESASGVSIDEEMVDLQRAQRGYEAIIKVVQVADEMLQTLMQMR